MPDTSPVLSLPFVAPAQAQKHVTVNEALTRLDVLARLCVRGFDAETPPEAPQEGEVWALGTAPTGDWSGEAGRLAAFVGGGWLFIEPREGWIAAHDATSTIRVHRAGGWVAPRLGDTEVSALGVGTAADAGNALSVRGSASLFSHDGADHRLAVNKAGSDDTATMLFQSAWSGRAEIGCAGSDNWSIKVSADGTTWLTAMRFDAVTGVATGAAVQAAPDDTTPGRLMRADWGYGPATVVGTVSQADGMPTGAAIETGETPAGSYTRLADGTQICRIADFATTVEGAATWSYPAPFATTPAVTASPVGSVPCTVTLSALTAGSVDVSSFDASGLGSVAPVCCLIAVGRWF